MSAEREGLRREARLFLSQMAKRYVDEGQLTAGPRALAVTDYDFRRACAWMERLLALLDARERAEPVAEPRDPWNEPGVSLTNVESREGEERDASTCGASVFDYHGEAGECVLRDGHDGDCYAGPQAPGGTE